MRRNPFKQHRFPATVILLAVRWYCRYPLSYRDLRDLLAERGVVVDASTLHRWVRKFGPEIAKRCFKHLSWRGLDWHMDETYVRVNGRWCYLWRAIDQHGRNVDFRLTARRNVQAARVFFRQAQDNARLYQPMTITTDKAQSYRTVIAEFNAKNSDGNGSIRHVDQKWKNNRIESDHAALKRLINPMRGFKSMSSVKATIKGIEAIRTIRHSHVNGRQPGIRGEVRFIENLFGIDA